MNNKIVDRAKKFFTDETGLEVTDVITQEAAIKVLSGRTQITFQVVKEGLRPIRLFSTKKHQIEKGLPARKKYNSVYRG